MNIPKKMRAVVIEAPDVYGVQEVDVPRIPPGEVLVRVRAVAICGSDPKVFNGKTLGFWPPAFPFIAGHEWAGEIAALGPDITGFEVGDRVAGEAHKGCGKCENCKQGRYNLCLNYGKNDRGHRHYGFTTPGAYAEYNTFSTLAITRIPDHLSYEEATMCDTAGIALHGVELSGITPGGNVVVFGPGPIGMMALLFARSSGAGKVIVVGRGYRLELSRSIGADEVVDFERQDVVERARELTGGIGADEVFECSGAPVALAQSIKCARKGGRVVLMGMPPDWIVDGLPIKDVIMNEIKVIGSRGNPNTSSKVVGLMASGKISVKKLITHTFSMEQMRLAMETFVNRVDGAMKVVVIP